MKNGYVTIIGLLIVLFLLSFWFVKIYLTKSPETSKTQIETYREDVQKAEDIKKLLENKKWE